MENVIPNEITLVTTSTENIIISRLSIPRVITGGPPLGLGFFTKIEYSLATFQRSMYSETQIK
jgi:hypothetical protein